MTEKIIEQKADIARTMEKRKSGEEAMKNSKKQKKEVEEENAAILLQLLVIVKCLLQLRECNPKHDCFRTAVVNIGAEHRGLPKMQKVWCGYLLYVVVVWVATPPH